MPSDSPAHFIPELPGWRERCLPIERVGRVSFYHYDPYAQAPAKIERGHAKDLADVAQLIDRGFHARLVATERAVHRGVVSWACKIEPRFQ